MGSSCSNCSTTPKKPCPAPPLRSVSLIPNLKRPETLRKSRGLNEVGKLGKEHVLCWIGRSITGCSIWDHVVIQKMNCCDMQITGVFKPQTLVHSMLPSGTLVTLLGEGAKGVKYHATSLSPDRFRSVSHAVDSTGARSGPHQSRGAFL